MFCPRCGSLMSSRVVDGKPILACPRCGYIKKPEEKEANIYRKTTSYTRLIEKKEAIAIDIPAVAILDALRTCPRCNGKGVYYWRKQSSSAESSDIIVKTFKCPSCGFSWSEQE